MTKPFDCMFLVLTFVNSWRLGSSYSVGGMAAVARQGHFGTRISETGRLAGLHLQVL